MAAPITAVLTYKGTLVADQIDTSPWRFIGVQFPDYGTVPNMPQFDVEVLQPRNTDGARYRVGGAHFPLFRMLTVLPSTNFAFAKIAARQMELAKGDLSELWLTDLDLKYTVAVVDVKALANAKRPLGATGGEFVDLPGGGVSFLTDAMACVDTTWTLQVVAV